MEAEQEREQGRDREKSSQEERERLSCSYHSELLPRGPLPRLAPRQRDGRELGRAYEQGSGTDHEDEVGC